MGRLAGFKYHEVARKLRSLGWVFDRPGPGSHEIWRNSTTGHKVTYRIMPAKCRKARSEPFCAKRESKSRLF
jgi:predicted RNA binding protein YcfA (HicA-like mRNA interferase family)